MPQKMVTAIFMILELLGLAVVMLAMFFAPRLMYLAFIVMAVLSVVANYVLFMYSEKFAQLPKGKRYWMLLVSALTWIGMIFAMMYFGVFDSLA